MTYDEYKSDIEQWATCTEEDQAKIAKDWAKKYTIKSLRGFQAMYIKAIGNRYPHIDPSHSDTELDSYHVRLNITGWAIDHRAFVMNKNN